MTIWAPTVGCYTSLVLAEAILTAYEPWSEVRQGYYMEVIQDSHYKVIRLSTRSFDHGSKA